MRLYKVLTYVPLGIKEGYLYKKEEVERILNTQAPEARTLPKK